jgi:hypothetical protein
MLQAIPAGEEIPGGSDLGVARRRGMSPARVQGFLRGVGYPASKSRLLERARENAAPEDIVRALEQVTEGDYQRAVDVTREIGRLAPPRRGSGKPSPAHVLSFLRGIAFPTTLAQMIETAERREAPAEVVSALKRMPDRQYVRIVDISREIGRLR